MNFDLSELKPLADLLILKGAPMLATALLGPVGGTVASAVIPALASMFGLSPDAPPSEIASAVAKDDGAEDKIASVASAHSELLDWAKMAVDANQAALAAEPSFWGRLYVGGWRPAMGWTGVGTTVYQIVASIKGLALVPFDMFSLILALWAGLAGVRSVEMVKGVARTTLSTALRKRS